MSKDAEFAARGGRLQCFPAAMSRNRPRRASCFSAGLRRSWTGLDMVLSGRRSPLNANLVVVIVQARVIVNNFCR